MIISSEVHGSYVRYMTSNYDVTLWRIIVSSVCANYGSSQLHLHSTTEWRKLRVQTLPGNNGTRSRWKCRFIYGPCIKTAVYRAGIYCGDTANIQGHPFIGIWFTKSGNPPKINDGIMLVARTSRPYIWTWYTGIERLHNGYRSVTNVFLLKYHFCERVTRLQPFLKKY